MNNAYFAPAKINLSLHVKGRRADGYHLLDSLLAPISLGDSLTLKTANAYSLSVTGPYAAHAPVTPSNLVTRAVKAMEDITGKRADVAVTLTKAVPAGAGLGGGSADAAAVMHALNDMWDAGLSLRQLQTLGLKLGAELPFCLAGVSARIGGIGDVVVAESVPEQYGVIIWPGVTLATKEVFAAYRDERDAHNDLTEGAVRLAPVVGQALDALPGSRMSGSGSCVFAFADEDTANKTAADLAAAHPTWWVQSFKIIS